MERFQYPGSYSRALRRLLPLVASIVGLVLACGGDGSTSPAGPKVVFIEISSTSSAVSVGQSLQLNAIAKDSANAAVTSAPITWTAQPATVATVSPTGLVRGLAIGSANVTASSGGKSAVFVVPVRDSTSLPRALSGRIERVNVNLTGDYRVTGDLVIIADSALRINGNILVAPNASVTLWADELLELSGTIGPDTTATARRASANGTPLAAIDQDFLFDLLVGAQRINVQNHILRLGCPVFVTGSRSAAPQLVVANATVFAAIGSPGTKASPTGGEGCAIEIGTAAAQQGVENATGKQTQSFTHLGILNSTFHSGAGGPGFSVLQRQDGRVVGNKWEATTGDGGKGGHIGIAATNLEIRGADINPGPGGLGGALIVELQDGSGPLGDGESMFATIGNAGANGDLDVTATNVLAAEGLRERVRLGSGSATISGGNGVLGAAGGDLRIAGGRRSDRGKVNVPAGVQVQPPPPDPLVTSQLVIKFAANGGSAATPQEPGGRGGHIIIEGSLSGSTAVGAFEKAILSNVSSGGFGWDGCIVRPKQNGTNGGPAGTLKLNGLEADLSNSFHGGGGGNGNPAAGTGGGEGRDIDNGNKPIGAKGPDGVTCPDFFSLLVPLPGFNHVIGETACPQSVSSPTLTNTGLVAINYAASVSGTTTLAFGNANGSLQPGSSTSLPLTFDCSTTNSFNALLNVNASQPGGGAAQTISVPFAGNLMLRAVRLNHNTGPYSAGTVIPLSRIVNGNRIGSHIPFCSYEHLHGASPAGISIRNTAGTLEGPFPDPETGGCGYGEIITTVQPIVSPTRRP